MDYDTWKTTPPAEDGPPEGYVFCQTCADRGHGEGPGWFEPGEPCDCYCAVCFELVCQCLEDNPAACAAWHEDNASDWQARYEALRAAVLELR